MIYTEKDIKDKFNTLLNAADSIEVEEEAILLHLFKEILENPEYSKYIYYSDLTKYNLLKKHKEVYYYILDKKDKFNEHMEMAIRYDLFNFVETYFPDWLKERFDIGNSPYFSEAYLNVNLKKALISYVSTAITSNSHQVVEFLLTDEKVLSLFSKYPYTNEDFLDFGKKAYLGNNTDSMLFILQSTKIKFNKSFTSYKLFKSNDQLAYIKKETIDFYQDYSDNIKFIDDKIQYFVQEFIHNPFDNVISEFENFLNTKPLNTYDVAYNLVIDIFFDYSAEYDLEPLMLYLLDSKNLKYNADPLANDQRAYCTSCEHNYPELTDILLKRIYEKSKENDFTIKLNSSGLSNAIENEQVNTVKQIFKYPEIVHLFPLNQFFSEAVEYFNKDIINLIVDKSFYNNFDGKINSTILEQYPYPDTLASIIRSQSSNRAEKIEYLLNEPKLNPRSCKNFNLNSIKEIDIKNMYQSLFSDSFLNGRIDVLNYFVNNDNIYPYVKDLINDNLVQHACSRQLFQIKHTDMIDFLLIELNIPKSENLYKLLDEMIYYDRSVFSDSIIKEKDKYTEYSQYTKNLYDMIEMNEKLTVATEAIASKKIVKKKKV